MSRSGPHLTCELRFPERDDRTPTIRLSVNAGTTICSIPTSEPDPCLPLRDHSVRSLSALDILEHVHDEQTWLAEFSRVLALDGMLTVRAPLDNALAWLDALNIYRYVSDTTGRGEHPLESFPIGWHRHYAPDDLPAILELAGFAVLETRTQGFPLGEIPHLAGLLFGNLMLQHPEAERRLFELRSRWRAGRKLRMPEFIAASLVIHATLIRSGFDPDPDLDETDRPEEQAVTPLE